MKTKKMLLMIPFLFLIMGMIGCGNDDKKKCLNSIEAMGIIRYYAPPDNCNAYVIEINGKIYKPDYLKSDFEKNNLSVVITYCLSEELHDCGFGGHIPIIFVENIKIEEK